MTPFKPLPYAVSAEPIFWEVNEWNPRDSLCLFRSRCET
jgi:hypothetical protein